jgi:hypothetical protein
MGQWRKRGRKDEYSMSNNEGGKRLKTEGKGCSG